MVSKSIKSTILRAAGRCIRTAPAAWLARGFFRRRFNVVFLHGIWERGTVRRNIFGGLYTDQFATLIDSLSTFFEFVGIDEILRPRAKGRWDTKPKMHLTFDDGLDLVGSGAIEVLDAKGISTTVFINTACVTNAHLMWQHLIGAIRSLKGDAIFLNALNNLQERTGQALRVRNAGSQIKATRHWPMDRKDEYAAELWRDCGMPPLADFLDEHRPYLGWDQLANMICRGHTIGFHTHTHPFSSCLSEAQIESEMVAPISQMRAQLGISEIPFAYPFGDHLVPEREARLAESGMFSCLMGTGRFTRIDDRSPTIGRIEIEADIDVEVFSRPMVQAMRSALSV